MKINTLIHGILGTVLFGNPVYSLSHRATTTIDRVQYINDLKFSSSPSELVAPHVLNISFTLSTDNVPIQLVLKRNEHIYSQPVTVHRLESNGQLKSVEELIPNTHHAYYGSTFINGNNVRDAGWVRITTHTKHGHQLFQGVVNIDNVDYNIQTDYNYRMSRQYENNKIPKQETPYLIAVSDDEDKENHGGGPGKRSDEGRSQTCGLDSNNKDQQFGVMNGQSSFNSLLPRQNGGGMGAFNPVDVIGSTQGCPSRGLIALLGIATDCTYRQRFQSDDDMRQHLVTQVNSASRVYEQAFNVSLRIRNITIGEPNCSRGSGATATPWNQACSSGVTIGDRLGLISAWKRPIRDDTAIWTLMTTCNTGSTVGIAFLGTTCHQMGTSRGNTVVNPSVNVVAGSGSEWQILAHEIGHNFGASHDCTSECSGDRECCPFSRNACDAQGQFMMNPAVNPRSRTFSPCSIGTICTSIGRSVIRTACMENNEGTTVITGRQCGNGIVDPGEDCDCGSEAQCAGNTCCDPGTCRFRPGAACDASNGECCTAQCQLAASGSVCRASTGLCDPAETCSGSTAACPRDAKLSDGDSCGLQSSLQAGNTTCASGQCTSRQMQCAAFFSVSNSTTQACETNQCQLNCLRLDSGSDTCQQTGQRVIDGTPCDGGRCYNGSCNAPSDNSVESWIRRNRTVFIVICVVGGLAIIGAALICCTCCRRRQRRKEAQSAVVNRMQQMAPPPPQMNNRPPFPAAHMQGPYQAPPIQGPYQGRVERRGSNLPRYG